MKKLFLTVGLLTVFVMQAHAQGTIQFGSGPLAVVRDLDGQLMSVPFNVAVYFAPSPGAWQGPVQPIGRSSLIVPGAFGTAAPYPIPGTDAGQVVSLQIYAWTTGFGDDPYVAWASGARTAITEVRQFQLGPTVGPGTVIWSRSEPTRLQPPQFNLGPPPPPPVVPEPSSLAITTLCCLLLLFRWRKSAGG